MGLITHSEAAYYYMILKSELFLVTFITFVIYKVPEHLPYF